MESTPTNVPPNGANGASPNGGPVWTGTRLTGWALASVLAGLMLTLLLAALDQTIVGTALPRIIADLHGANLYIWPTTAYLLASTTSIPIVGKLSDQYGRKWFLVGGIVIFLSGSALSGAANTMEQLIAFRAWQGLGGGALMALVFTSIGDIFSPAERARWQGLFTAVFGLASVIGPAVGGFITDNFTWRWVFYVNLPVGVLALLTIIFGMPANISLRTERRHGWAAIRRIDFLGGVSAAAATVLLLLGLSWGGYHTYAWNSPLVLGTLIGAGVLYILFFVAERFAAEPILPMDLFRNQVFAVGAILSLLIGMALFAVVIYLPLFIQAVQGHTATSSGAVATPLTLSLAIGAAIVGQVIARVGRYQVFAVIGSLIMMGGIYLVTLLTIDSSLVEVTRDMIVIGLGMGMIQPVMTLAVQNAIPRARLGVGTAAVTYLRSTGSTLGVAVVGAVEYNSYSNYLANRLPASVKPSVDRLVTQVNHSSGLNLSRSDVLQQLASTSPSDLHKLQATAAQQAVAQATANVPAGPAHDQIVANIMQNLPKTIDSTFAQIMDATRHSLAVGIHDGFVAGLIVCAVVVVTTLFLKDVPLQKREAPAAANGEASAAPQDAELVVPHGV
ncbi:MAG TPA: MDR family MFS transporter [Ktedonobacterales bacterium]|nr:MDR family MFS transporter [Ktedonobacterales bacterium]